jgi:hypothetical protein
VRILTVFVVLVVLVLLVVFHGASLAAHALSVSYAQVVIGDRRVDAVIRLPLDDVDLLLRLDRDLDGAVSPAEIEAAGGVLRGYLVKHVHVRADGTPLQASVNRLATWKDPNRVLYLEADLSFAATQPIHTVAIDSDFLTELYPAHKTLGGLQIAGRHEQFVFEPHRAYEGHVAASSAWATLYSFVRLGVEHIFTGYDHILFLFGLLLVGTGLRNLVAVVTSFTVAHSTTLALATLGVVQPVPWTIEAAIALSIAYIGIENLLVPTPRYRWKITLLFGLVHGFGFANVLREMHLARTGLAMSLFVFNAGVEIGQIAIVSLMYPVLQLLARTPYRLPVTRVASVVIVVVGLFWFYQRIP